MSGQTKDQLATENAALKRRMSEMANENDQLKEVTKSLADKVDTLMINVKQPGSSEPMEQQIGQDGVTAMDTITGELDRPGITNPDSPEFNDKMAMEAFMQEPVTVLIQHTNEEHEAPYFEISVNGTREIFHRGEQKTVKRLFVEGLARAKPVKFRNEEYMREGIRTVRWPSTTGLRYPFSVVEDRNPKGPAWLKAVLAQP